MPTDVSAERIILGGIINHGHDAFLDVSDILQDNTFTDESNRLIYHTITEIYKNDHTTKIDVPSIISTATRLGFGDKLRTKTEFQHLNALTKVEVELTNVRKFASTIRKLQIARDLQNKLKTAHKTLDGITGVEPLNDIISLVENPLFDFSNLLRDNTSGPQLISHNLRDYIEYLKNHPRDIVGISTGFKYYDFAIGGGLRRQTVNMIGARPKVGKTTIALNMAKNISDSGTKVLFLDTEMDIKTQQVRLMACLSGLDIKDIETGKFAQNAITEKQVFDAVDKAESLGFYYRNISGQPFEETLSLMRRWIAQEVGYDGGVTRDCVVVLDYLKLMDSAVLSHNIAEFQELGFIMTSLHNFSVKHDIPVLSFLQLNRDGIDEESTRVASGSDRIIWLCSNFTIYKEKSPEEAEIDGPEYGNRKLVPIVARHGEGLDYGDYINVMFQRRKAQVIETTTKSNIIKEPPVADSEQFEESEA